MSGVLEKENGGHDSMDCATSTLLAAKKTVTQQGLMVKMCGFERLDLPEK